MYLLKKIIFMQCRTDSEIMRVSFSSVQFVKIIVFNGVFDDFTEFEFIKLAGLKTCVFIQYRFSNIGKPNNPAQRCFYNPVKHL